MESTADLIAANKRSRMLSQPRTFRAQRNSTSTLHQLVFDNRNSSMRDNLKRNRPAQHKTDVPPDRFELFLLDDGQKKVEWKDETRVPNTAIFTFNKEDHTLGNLISQRLHKYQYIQFSAYKVPHPLFATFELRVTTDGSVTPKQAIITCCQDVISELDNLNRQFTTEWLGKRIVSEGEQERMAREQNPF